MIQNCSSQSSPSENIPMKKLILLIPLSLFLLSGCGKEDSNASKNVVTENETIQFKEILLLLNIKTSDSTYLVVNTIDSVNLYINGSYWSKINSIPTDTTNIARFTIGNRTFTKNKLNYLIIASQDINEPNYTTAGEFSQYLNSFLDLETGEYACLIESFKIKSNDNSIQKYFPYVYATFKVTENTASAFAGEIEIKIF